MDGPTIPIQNVENQENLDFEPSKQEEDDFWSPPTVPTQLPEQQVPLITGNGTDNAML
ncbi:hypothetical protein H0H81_003150, partial [Sphagnurus paluster]